MRRARVILLLLAIALTAACGTALGEESQDGSPKQETVEYSAPQTGRPTPEDAFAAVRYLQDVEAQQRWYFGVHMAEVARQQAAAARPRGGGGYHPGTTVGECTGFAIPDYIISRESGGNPSAYNPSGAYGCAQTLLSHYSSGSCQGLDPYSIDGQRACVDILSNGGTNLAPWAATR